tara:strand:+ start:1600 stop:1827 length:228 start_codon:yes stop_codon:yes gene_type:complete
MLNSKLEKYILSLKDKNYEEKLFIIYQLKKMPDHYLLGIKFICLLLKITRLSPKRIKLLDKLLSSLSIVRLYEDN